MSLSFRTTQEGDHAVLGVVGEIDLGNRDDLRNALVPLVASGRRVVIDLSAVDFIDSSGLGVLLGAKRDAETSGGGLALVIVNPHVLKVFTITNLTEVFSIHRTVPDALG